MVTREDLKNFRHGSRELRMLRASIRQAELNARTGRGGAEDPAEASGRIARYKALEKRLAAEQERLCEIAAEGGEKENRDINPIGRRTDNTVVGVKQNGNEGKPCQYADERRTGEVRPRTKKEALKNILANENNSY